MDIMIDIETLGSNFDAAIVQVGWCLFDPFGEGIIGQPSTIDVELASSLEAGLKVEAQTIEWWMVQSEEARAIFASKDKQPLASALEALRGEFDKHQIRCVWACPPRLDLAILRNCYKVVARSEPPWHHRVERCLWTLCALVGYDRKTLGPHPTIPHNAGYDAEAQVKQCQAAYKWLLDSEWPGPPELIGELA